MNGFKERQRANGAGRPVCGDLIRWVKHAGSWKSSLGNLEDEDMFQALTRSGQSPTLMYTQDWVIIPVR